MGSPNYIYFGLKGDFDPEVVAQGIDLEPTESRAKSSGDSDRKLPHCSLMRFAQTYADQDEPVLDLYELAERVVDQLEPYTQQFAEAIMKHDAEPTFQVVFEFPVSDDVSTPALGFSRRVIQFVAATRASIDMDSYRS